MLGLLTLRSLLMVWRYKGSTARVSVPVTASPLIGTLLGQLWGLAMASLLLLPALLDQAGIS
ncbi:hypothetical protein ACKC4X_21890, partial [Aeromonas veronii]